MIVMPTATQGLGDLKKLATMLSARGVPSWKRVHKNRFLPTVLMQKRQYGLYRRARIAQI